MTITSPILNKAMLKHIVISILLEFGPVLIFLASFEDSSIYESTVILMIATIISTLITYRLQKRIPYLALYVAFITIIFGSMTIHHHQPKFIQMRDTLYDATCALTLLIGVLINVQFLKIAFHDVLPMTDRAWAKLTYLWITYFIVIAASNEIIRRTMSLDGWFYFKGIVVLVTAVFGLAALVYCYEPLQAKEKLLL